MPVGYRSIFTVRGDQDPVSVAAGQFRSWLRSKHYEPDALTPGMHDVEQHAQLVVTELRPQDGSHALRYRLTESRPTGEWVTTLTARQGGRQPGWIWIDVSAPPSARSGGSPVPAHADLPGTADPRWVAVPRLVRNILQVTDARDGELVLDERPTIVTPDELDGLIEAICDPGRRGAALVAAPIPGVPLPPLIDHVAELTRECAGLAGMYVLDGDAAAELEESFGRLHSVPPGSIRTYLPGTDPASVVDARRHRLLLARTIVAQPAARLARMLGRVSRDRSMNLPLPPHVSRVDRLLAREEPAAVLKVLHEGTDSTRTIQLTGPGAVGQRMAVGTESALPVEAEQPAVEAGQNESAATRVAAQATSASILVPLAEVAAAPAAPDGVGGLLADLVREFTPEALSDEPASETSATLVGRLQHLLADARAALRAHRELSRRVTALQDSLEETQDERDQARTRLEDEQLDHAETHDELLRAKAEAERLRAALAMAGRVDQAWAPPAELPQPPGSFAELLDRLDDGAVPGIVFTGDAKHALELDDQDPIGTWAAKTWEILRVLDGYADAREKGEFSQGVHAYLSQTPPGRPGYSPRAHAARESDSVENSAKFRQPRMLPVPPEVCADGAVFMGAHFKIALKGLVSPRMHYYDGTAKTGKIYIGYIGKHLPNKQTN
jgi:hypothetical protein